MPGQEETREKPKDDKTLADRLKDLIEDFVDDLKALVAPPPRPVPVPVPGGGRSRG